MQPTAQGAGTDSLQGHADRRPTGRSSHFLLKIIIFFVLVTLVRGTFLWQFRAGLQQDPDAYREIAENILHRGVFGLGRQSDSPASKVVVPTAYRPPLYPLLLALVGATDTRPSSLAKVALVHLLLGVATVVFTWFCAWRYCQMPQWQATLAGLIVACDPILLHQQSLVMTETLAALAAILAFVCLARWSWRPGVGSAALAGATLGVASLCRPTFLPWLVVVAVAIAVVPKAAMWTGQEIRGVWEQQGQGAPIARRLVCACVVALSGLAVLLPWGLRNAWVFGRPILTTTHGGYTLELGNNPDFYDWLTSHEALPWDSRAWQAERQATMSRRLGVEPPELFWDRWAYQRAWQTIRQRPNDFARACLYRVLQLWSPLPHRLTVEESATRQVGRWAVAGWYCGVYLLAIYGLARLRQERFTPPWLWGMLLVAVWTSVHTLYWTNLRMRAPLIPFLALLAGHGAGTAYATLRALRRARRHARSPQHSGAQGA